MSELFPGNNYYHFRRWLTKKTKFIKLSYPSLYLILERKTCLGLTLKLYCFWPCAPDCILPV